jgi:glycine cleavage system H protein
MQANLTSLRGQTEIMSFLPDDRFYTANHFWIARAEVETGTEITIGLTQRGADDLGELNFAELPPVGKSIQAGTGFGVIESVKSVQELVSPFAGTISAVNPKIAENPEIINDSPLDEGWLVKIQVDQGASFSHLLNAADYERLFKVR